MRLTSGSVLTILFLLAFTSAVLAGDYHAGGDLGCHQCHNMHASKSHLYGDDTNDGFNPGGGFAASGMLLLQSDITSLCLSCHDGQQTIDVYGVTPQGGQPAVRSAGMFNNDASSAYAPFASPYGHNLKNGEETPPGGSDRYDLDCTSCHDPHGNAYYRNLKDLGSGGVTYAKTTNDTGMDVFELKPYPASSAQDAYDAANISYNLSQSGHGLEEFCVSCHTNIHSSGQAGGGWSKHPTAGAGTVYTEGTVSPLKTLGGTPVAGGSGDLVGGEVSCITCHKAHGSTHPFGLIYDSRLTAELEDGDGNLRETCQHCHDKGL